LILRWQGFQLDQDVKVAVEASAMKTVTELYSEAWTVEDVHGSRLPISGTGRAHRGCM